MSKKNYDYECEKCGKVQEFYIESDTSHEPQTCEICQRPIMRKCAVASKQYRIFGDNSASTTPDKFR